MDQMICNYIDIPITAFIIALNQDTGDIISGLQNFSQGHYYTKLKYSLLKIKQNS
jgi:hypothetical protein